MGRSALGVEQFSRSLVQELAKDNKHYPATINKLLSACIIKNPKSQNQPEKIQSKGLDLLHRMPAQPGRLYDIFQLEHHEYFGITTPKPWDVDFPKVPSIFESEDQYVAQKVERAEKIWTLLVAAWPMDDNTLKIAQQIAALEEAREAHLAFCRDLQDYVNFLSCILDSMDLIHHPAPHSSGAEGFKLWAEAVSILRLYISISWQRTCLLLFYYVISVMLREGWSAAWSDLFAVKALSNTDWNIYHSKPKYMCSQAFELVRRSKAAACLDFRVLFSRFGRLSKGKSARCDQSHPDYVCDGNLPRNCTRFAASTSVKEQSMHDTACISEQCHLIRWDEASYDSLSGDDPRAVDIGANTSLLYCTANSETLAISHVWSHGQGGRPETGINSCLHDRYIRLAKKHGSSSYWIDTCCIPTDHKRRTKAIKGINYVFRTSKLTIICDKDIMAVDTEGEHVYEDLLAVLCVADWNVRGWTLLEGTKGSPRLHLLCKDNETVAISTVFRGLQLVGSLDLVAFISALQHLLPNVKFGYEDTGYLLGRRHSSRPGDEAIIWGLIARNIASISPLAMIQSLQTVKTGFLVSFMPRMKQVGYRWAPAVAHCQNDFSGFDGDGSEVGYVTPRGLLAIWLVHEINNSTKNQDQNTMEDRYKWDATISMLLSGQKMSDNGTWIYEPLGKVYRRLIFIQPKSVSSNDPYIGHERTAIFRQTVLCGSDDGVDWLWLKAISFNVDMRVFDNIGNHFEERQILLV